LLVFAFLIGASVSAFDLPVDRASIEQDYTERENEGVRNLLTFADLFGAIGNGGPPGFEIDFSAATSLLDGSTIDPTRIHGTIYAGPYPFEASENSYAYKRFRLRSRVREGRAILRVDRLIDSNNSEDWTDSGQLCVRFDLQLAEPGVDRHLGVYDTFLLFRRTADGFEKLPSILEGPFVGLIQSEDPTRLLVAFRTSEAIEARVVLDDGRSFLSDSPVRRHEIAITGLLAETRYRYRVEIGGSTTCSYGFKTAPKPGKSKTIFAYAGDSREGRGGGMSAFMGHNHATAERLASLAFNTGAEFLLMGGDLVNGHTTSEIDFATQLQAWKQAVSGFWSSRPVYPVIGNHESLLRSFRSDDRRRVALDRWPYETASAEAVFAREFLCPENGPEPSDPRRPTYKENVYSFQHGSVFCIAFNNNYWVAYHSYDHGGSPEGYILNDQMAWIESELERAEKNRTVRYVLLYAQEPIFPNGGHVGDAMWWRGDNTVRASTFNQGEVIPEPKGIIEVRNDFARMVGRYSKVAAVLTADEHSYHRVLIDRDVPIGDMTVDDKDENGRIDWPDEPCSPLSDLRYPTWYLTSGGAGAPYYAEEPSPWNQHWKQAAVANPSSDADLSSSPYYYYSSQENLLIFRAYRRGLTLQVLNAHGELIDEIGNLMQVKN
jgi:hypothetical protein